jgi:hypothetical protein
MTRRATTLLTALLLVVCHVRADATGPLLPVRLASDSGLVDIDMPVTSVQYGFVQGCVIRTRGAYKRQQVGIDVLLPSLKSAAGASSASSPNTIAEIEGGVILESQGASTQNFMRMLSSLYKRPASAFVVPHDVRLTAVVLHGDPLHIKNSPVEMKVFHGEDDSKPDYFELFINFDLPHGSIEFAEKDPDYRRPILLSFGARLRKQPK